jgi:general secretion pathway protein G
MQNLMKIRNHHRRGFTLIELVVVVLILGIIGAIAAPKMLNTMATAKTNSAKQNVQIVRAAIEMFKTQDPNNGYPPANATTPLATSLAPYLKGPFPASPLANANNTVADSSATPLVYISGNSAGWLYNSSTGDFALNDATGVAY